VELLKQSQYRPQPVEEQVVSIFLGTRGHLDSVPVGDIRRFESEFLDHVRRNQEGILGEIRDTGKLSDELDERITGVVKEFKENFTASDGSSVVPKEAEAEALDEEDVDRESVKVNKPAPADSSSKSESSKSSE
jgi:F-type H+-transporting ATPase subunit alpha